MPRTRNVTRSQWNAANAVNGSKKENGYDSEKENGARATRSRATRNGAGRTALGALTTTAQATATSKSKGKGKPKPPPKGSSTKVEKLPLQDITSRYLPAPESANRGQSQPSGFGEPEHLVLSPAGPSNTLSWLSGSRLMANPPIHATDIRSSLPPSSPPSASSRAVPALSLPQLPVLSRSPTPIADNVARRLFVEPDSAAEVRVYDTWQEFDYVVSESDLPSKYRAPRTSDPFGFVALEEQLQADREQEMEEAEAAKLALVGPASPDAQPSGSSTGLEYVDPPPHVKQAESTQIPPTPPTPRKRKDRGESLRRVNEYIFSPGPSSCPTSPSPSKPRLSSAKRKVAVSDVSLEEEDQSTPQAQKSLSGRKRVKTQIRDDQEEGIEPPVRRSQRGRTKLEQVDGRQDVETGNSRRSRSTKPSKKQARSTSTNITKSKSKSSKSTAIPHDSQSDAAEQWERTRQARLDYIRQLEDYKVETEDVYVI
ncbi:hypothetical protein FA15DRAFT_667557 [Coprinopsis marcescibilis]|uniref:Uncharacterized protein n=1 Tax=Coprinopsis marcescibilis TaxID=230819 RepID=A0A5C3L0R2_COPMA|nr:hypothetical protein FA15DRAFT_667557 [Coprinopsis marcescibilis]